jgi:hypothetical protein
MRVLLCVAVMAALQAAPALAQSAPPACFGDLATVRLSQIKPGGTLQGFLKAVEAHKAWYRANGITDNDIVAARVLAKDDKGLPTGKYSDTEVMSFHLRPPVATRTPHKNDAGWQAFIKQYRDNSDLKLEYFACIPHFIRGQAVTAR